MEKSKAQQKADQLIKRHNEALEKAGESIWKSTLADLLLELLGEQQSITKADLVARATACIEGDEPSWQKASCKECIRHLSE